MTRTCDIPIFLVLAVIILMSCSSNSHRTYENLILGKWFGNYNTNEIQLSFTKKSNLTVEYIKTGNQLFQKYNIKGDTLYVNGEKHSLIRKLNEKELKLRPLTKEIKENIDIIHIITFTRITTQQKED